MTGATDRPLPRARLAGDSLEAARALLGARLVREPATAGAERRVGRIVEVEAYVGQEDRASHARMGPTARNQVMFGPAGFAYVYLVYGLHRCLNVVTGPDGFPAAVLLRAVRPIEGAASMRAARLEHALARGPAGRDAARAAADRLARVDDARLCAGPGNLGAAFGIRAADNGLDLCDPASGLYLAAGTPPGRVIATPRVGIDFAGPEWAARPWRLVAADADGG